MNDIRLHGAAVYNPALSSREELKDYFVARTELLDRIVADLRQEQPGGPCRHRLILGLRGMGKSTLLRRIGIAVEEDAELGKCWLPLTFPEEQYNISTAADLWRNCLDAFSDLLEERGRKDEADALDKVVNAVEDALARLLAEADNLGCRLLLLMDNMDLILERLKGEQEQLRTIFQRESRLLLIGASTKQMDADFFHATDELQGLSVEEMRATLRKLAELGKTPQVAQLLDDDPARIKTLHNLTGGNPRTIVLLYNVLARGLDGDVRSDLEGLLDLVTPLYKARFEELPQQAQQLMNGLAVNWDPMTARQLADKLVWDVNTASAQLNRLQQQGHVKKVDAASGKRAAFQIGERFFNIWYLMRASRRERRKLIWLVHFLRMFFSAAELQGHAKKLLREEKSDVRSAEYKLALAQTIEDRFLKEELNYDALRCLLRQEKDSRKIEEMFDLKGEDAELRPLLNDLKIEALIDQAVQDGIMTAKDDVDGAEKVAQLYNKPEISAEAWLNWFVEQGDDNLSQEQEQQAESAFRVALEADLSNHSRWKHLGNLLKRLKRFDEAEQTYRKAIEIAPDDAVLASFFEERGRFDEAEQAYRKAIEIAPDNAYIWSSLASFFEKRGRVDEAEQAYRKAVEIEPEAIYRWLSLARFLQRERINEAEQAYRKAVEIAPDNAYTWSSLASFFEKRGRVDEAEQAYRKAIEIAPDNAYTWSSLASFLAKRGRVDEAEQAYRKAVEIEPEATYRWSSLARFLQTRERLDEAEQIYRKAIEIAPDNAYTWSSLASFLEERGGRVDEAEQAYRKAIEIAPDSADSWFHLARFLQQTERIDEAKQACQKAFELKPDNAWDWDRLANLLRQLEYFDEAEQAYKKTIELEPNVDYFWADLANFLKEHKRLDEAEQGYRKAVELKPDIWYYYFNIAALLYRQQKSLDEAIIVAKKCVEFLPEEERIFEYYLLSILLVANKQWQEAEPYFRDLLLNKGDDEFLEENWQDMLTLFQEAVRTGRAAEALALLEESPLAERWRPLREALAAADEGTSRYLNGVAEEVRQPALEILKTIAPDVLPPYPLQGNA